ncbi:hypothetical protein OV203_18530 [Nannocystis sp. ILAH1]|uniref:hypothetical protein n=1 Tax=unclassified Nannocystis TaxID=2627009 RepID=UPI00226D4615|nr:MULTISPECIES: hypothetical protein [unclassified Nannocystis]MCY0989140.1 hypothetical protein [Nannocystis sp. ILAH1]MCY1067926.1 hypothetical protein [Nannocystis sp. RBIL2]
MSGSIMTLIFLGVPFLFVIAVLVRGALRTVQQWRFDRLARIDAPHPVAAEAPLPAVRRPG